MLVLRLVSFSILNYYTVSLIYCRCSSFNDKEMVDCYHNCECPSLLIFGSKVTKKKNELLLIHSL